MLIYEASSGRQVVNASVDAEQTDRDTHGFICAPVAAPGVLEPRSSYVLLAANAGCDSYHDDVGTTVSVVGGAAAGVKSVYGAPPHVIPGGGGAGHCYGPLNFYFGAA